MLVIDRMLSMFYGSDRQDIVGGEGSFINTDGIYLGIDTYFMLYESAPAQEAIEVVLRWKEMMRSGSVANVLLRFSMGKAVKEPASVQHHCSQ